MRKPEFAYDKTRNPEGRFSLVGAHIVNMNFYKADGCKLPLFENSFAVFMFFITCIVLNPNLQTLNSCPRRTLLKLLRQVLS